MGVGVPVIELSGGADTFKVAGIEVQPGAIEQAGEL
jgi:hypothetical protein